MSTLIFILFSSFIISLGGLIGILTLLLEEKVLDKILLFIGKHFPRQTKITLAGHNVHFDAGFLRSFFSANNKNFSEFFSHRIIDTSSILYYLYLAGRIKQRAISSDEAFNLFDIKVEGRHTAIGDAIATAKLFTKLLDLLK